MKQYYVYKIHRKKDLNIKCRGYYGITVDPIIRIQAHRRNARNGKDNPLSDAIRTHDDIIFTVLYEGLSLAEAKRIERQYRPKPNLGWNVAKGGIGGSPHTAESRRKLREAWTVRAPISKETKRKMSAAKIGVKQGPASEEAKRKMSASSMGKKHTEETKKKISNARLGKKRKPFSKETKRRMSLARRRYEANRKKQSTK